MAAMDIIARILSNNIVNQTLRSVLFPIKKHIPERFRTHIPVIGIIKVKIEDKYLLLKSEGADIIATKLYWEGIDGFEKETIVLYQKLLENCGVILDIGANTGIYSLIAGRDTNKRIYAFEPVPRVYKRMVENIELNNFQNVVACPEAVSNHDGFIDIYVPRGEIPTDSSLIKDFRDDCEEIRVHTSSLDHFVIQRGIRKIDLIKIDTEGTEHLVLKGGMNLLKRDRPIILCEVLYGRTESDLHSLLDGLGYSYYWIKENELVKRARIVGDKSFKELNWLFIPETSKPSGNQLVSPLK